ncbi:hypothetical protein RFM68_20305 [Mesorhizobium sp. MSK_1335]|uniref:Apea-like HEPN domain-containing protein n=1 Tax=Mesorhizobium montanum TaxID=3072323 RepID=A0ABU4ZNA0_9HYPH|nr:hypothetical protein [Mesorhizobium sp. MSK_1335]MDX8526846.1 hypothetical protein [Mesorhizobium sp. MSK_1335]
MNKPIGFRVRLRVRIGKPLTTDELSRSVALSGQEVTIRSQQKDQPLSQATWIVLSASGFATEEEAKNFGARLRLLVEIAALSSRLGTDVGADFPTSWVNEEFARSIGLLQPDERLAPDIHGLLIIPDDDKTRIPTMEMKAQVTADPAHLLGALRELAETLPTTITAVTQGVRVLNLALMSSQPLAQIVLAFSAVEALGQDETWTKAQTALIEKLAEQTEKDASENDLESLEVADALRRSLHRIGLRQGVVRVLTRTKLDELKKEWDYLYGIRSGLFHGTLAIDDHRISKLAVDAVTLCGRVILKVLEQEGVKVPKVASLHFGKFDI